MDILLVGIGGVLGSLLRYTIDGFISKRVKGAFPLDTFIINLTGAFLVGFLSGLVLNLYLNKLLVIGFLGAYTTFSTFMAEGINLIDKNKKFNSYAYVVISTVLGLVLCYLGYTLGKTLL